MKTILVVESDRHQRLLYQMELEDDGYHVTTAAGMDEAAQKMEGLPPDCIVLGISPRNRFNPSTMNLLRNDLGIPVVVNTTSSDCGGEAVQLLADDCVIKSSNVEELKQKVRLSMERGRSNASDRRSFRGQRPLSL